MISQEEVQRVIGSTLYTHEGDKVGSVGQVFLDDQTQQPAWATVNTGFFGSNESFVPLAEASLSGDELRVPYTKDQIKDAPNVSVDQGHISEQEEAALYRHYGLQNPEWESDSGLPAGTTAGVGTDESYRTEGRDVSGPTTDDAMTRSEERLRVGTEQQSTGRARLRKYVVTENVQQSVPVTREEVRVEREPVTDANRDAATSGPDISEDEHEVTLTEERPVVQKETVPVERVRLATEQVSGEEVVSDEVRREVIDTEGTDERR